MAKPFIHQINEIRNWSLYLAVFYIFLAIVIDYYRFSYPVMNQVLIIRLVFMLFPIGVTIYLCNYQKHFKLNNKSIHLILSVMAITVSIGYSEITKLAHINDVYLPKIGLAILLIYSGLLLALPIKHALVTSTLILMAGLITYYQVGYQADQIVSIIFFYIMFSTCCIFVNYTYMKILRSNINLINKTNQLAYIDDLTGLYNRRYYYQHAEKVFLQGKREHKPVIMMLFDLDNFKSINDNFSHTYGDQILKQVAYILKKHCKRPLDFVSRIGGDEFILLSYDASIAYIKDKCQEIIDDINQLNEQLSKQNSKASLGISIGIATSDANGINSINDMMNKADNLLYHVKSTGKNNYQINQSSKPNLFSVNSQP